ncbi:sulfate/molybdate ABC transporter ATP-binding protein [Candidatus Clostridium stratigraminis]|uniref:Sulfate/molybdate ABC transporter ATP-binding protein n=1 Tax=Candidatus Clostridium stratigraminis TaxID=3381661 RepID=A0ABW8T267_9CLOT
MELIVDIKKNLSDFKLNVNFECKNSRLGILGESGSGKSMTLKCISGLVTPDEGRIILNGRTLFDSSNNINVPIKDRKIGFLFQNYALFPHMTVENNIKYALYKKTKEEQNNIVDKLLSLMHIEELRKRYPHEISGGQQQRAAIARALAVNPEALFLDEPLSALDNHLKGVMLREMSNTLSRYKGVTLYVTHNLDEAYQLCEDIMIISKGSIAAIGNKKEIFKKPPSAETAKLLGYKNISAAKKVSSDYIAALDWGLKIKVPNHINESITHIGIKENLIQFYNGENYNNFYSWPLYTSETPFSVLVYLSFDEKVSENSDYHLVWEVPIDKWENIRSMSKPWKIHLDESKIIFINEKN